MIHAQHSGCDHFIWFLDFYQYTNMYFCLCHTYAHRPNALIILSFINYSRNTNWRIYKKSEPNLEAVHDRQLNLQQQKINRTIWQFQTIFIRFTFVCLAIKAVYEPQSNQNRNAHTHIPLVLNGNILNNSASNRLFQSRWFCCHPDSPYF